EMLAHLKEYWREILKLLVFLGVTTALIAYVASIALPALNGVLFDGWKTVAATAVVCFVAVNLVGRIEKLERDAKKLTSELNYLSSEVTYLRGQIVNRQ